MIAYSHSYRNVPSHAFQLSSSSSHLSHLVTVVNMERSSCYFAMQYLEQSLSACRLPRLLQQLLISAKDSPPSILRCVQSRKVKGGKG